jgi:hypothetical protein
MTKWSSRWFLMSVVLSVGAFVLSWKFGEASSFTAIATVALGGGHFTNVMERRHGAGLGDGIARRGHTPSEPGTQARPIITEADR